MKPGDCINIPPEVKHWHGAAPDEWFSHLAIEVPGEECANEWCEAVTDEQYGCLKQEVLWNTPNWEIQTQRSLSFVWAQLKQTQSRGNVVRRKEKIVKK